MGPREVADRALTVGATAARRVTGDREPDDATLLGRADPDWAALLGDFRAGTGRPVLLDRDTATAVAAAHPEAVKELLAAARPRPRAPVHVLRAPRGPLPGPDRLVVRPALGRALARPAVARDQPPRRARRPQVDLGAQPAPAPPLARPGLAPDRRRALRHRGPRPARRLDHRRTRPGAASPGAGRSRPGVRAISVLVALQGLADHPALTPERYARAVRMLAAGARRCWRDRSKHSSANNHLVGELAGLATVAILLPELAASARWERDAVAALAVEADRQILPDGVGAEQAVGYQVFTAELLAVVALLRRLRPAHVPAPADGTLLAALGRSAAHLADLVGTGDPTPRTGDDDEGFALRLDPAPTREVRPHLALAAALTGTPGRPARGHDRPHLGVDRDPPGRGLRAPTSPGSPGPAVRPRRRAGDPARGAAPGHRRRRPARLPGDRRARARRRAGRRARRRRPRPRRRPGHRQLLRPPASGAPRTAAPARTPRSPSTTPTSR